MLHSPCKFDWMVRLFIVTLSPLVQSQSRQLIAPRCRRHLGARCDYDVPPQVSNFALERLDCCHASSPAMSCARPLLSNPIAMIMSSPYISEKDTDGVALRPHSIGSGGRRSEAAAVCLERGLHRI